MTSNLRVFPPTEGAPYAPDSLLPAPSIPETVIIVPAVADETERHVEIFSSEHPKYGDTARAFAQLLHTEVYLQKEFIEQEDLNEIGLYVDEYSDRSTYLYAKNGSKVTAARYIHADKKEGILSLPTAKKFEVDSDKLAEVAAVDKIINIKPSEAIEVSGLVARGAKNAGFDSTITTYARLLRDSLEQGHKLWLMNIEPRFMKVLGLMVGADQLHQLGPAKEYMGPATLPVALNPQKVVKSLLESNEMGADLKRAYLREVFDGVSDKKIPKELRGLLKEHGINLNETSAAKRVLTNPRTLAYAAITAYSATRALPAAAVEEFEGSTALLWTIDMATAPTYTWGVLEAFSGKTRGRRAVGAAVGGTSFSAPYIYFEAAGNDYPGYVNAIVATFIGTAVAKEVIGHYNGSRKERKLRANLGDGEFLPSNEKGFGRKMLKALGLSRQSKLTSPVI